VGLITTSFCYNRFHKTLVVWRWKNGRQWSRVWIESSFCYAWKNIHMDASIYFASFVHKNHWSNDYSITILNVYWLAGNKQLFLIK